ncbi:hypothetical protein EV646_12315 [Kribbella antiqua]|uniref:Bifunctional DNA primase/polymerase-like protein n=1 Tax=Kribbella antiqua TaxID=2512217 RepID=A0A4R2I3K9_9ACTN|nr:hypothetical protein [Kribbella antiqua]TCO37628.1 hypothetical protein EV646_12315 [Kribbella antiqua]
MFDLFSWAAGRHANRLQRLAVQYVDHDWPIARLAVPRNGLCPCELRECIDPHLVHTQSPAISTTTMAENAFCSTRWAIAILARDFDVLELPAQLGAPLHHHLKTQCPTSIAPTTRRWQFFVTAGSVPRDQLAAAGGRLIDSPSGWVIAPGTYTEGTGRTRWLTPPYVTHWRPYQRHDAIDAVLTRIDPSGPTAPTRPGSNIVADALA